MLEGKYPYIDICCLLLLCKPILLSYVLLSSSFSILHHISCLEPIFLHFSALRIAQRVSKALLTTFGLWRLRYNLRYWLEWGGRWESEEAEGSENLSLAQRGRKMSICSGGSIGHGLHEF